MRGNSLFLLAFFVALGLGACSKQEPVPPKETPAPSAAVEREVPKPQEKVEAPVPEARPTRVEPEAVKPTETEVKPPATEVPAKVAPEKNLPEDKAAANAEEVSDSPAPKPEEPAAEAGPAQQAALDTDTMDRSRAQLDQMRQSKLEMKRELQSEKATVAMMKARDGFGDMGGVGVLSGAKGGLGIAPGAIGSSGLGTGGGGLATGRMMNSRVAPSPDPAAHLRGQAEEGNTEEYEAIKDNPFKAAADNPLSTFSIDVDTASYSNLRRYLRDGRLPPTDAVLIEEMINYFTYDYPAAEGEDPFSISTEMSQCPWAPGNRVLLIGLKGKEIDTRELPPANLVFLLDVSGSMNSPDKLPLLKNALGLLVNQLRPVDKVSIVVYAGAAGQILPPTSGDRKAEILAALDKLQAGGSTAGGAGIQLAYQVAEKNFVKPGNNRVILATDGDFNVGVSSTGALTRLVEEKRNKGIFLTVLGFGRGNIKGSRMESLADKGNGNYAYIDSLSEARKVLVTQMGGTLVTIAKDVKIQVEFNPAKVAEYRLIGYVNRLLAKEDFADDTKDAGELGAGHNVTALYEIVPREGREAPAGEELKYSATTLKPGAEASSEMATVKLRYKAPDGDVSKLLESPVLDSAVPLAKASLNLQWASAVAQFGMLLRDSEHKGITTYPLVLELAKAAVGEDVGGYRAEFLELVKKARNLSSKPAD